MICFLLHALCAGDLEGGICRLFRFIKRGSLTRVCFRKPFVLARTVVLVSALALLGYLPLANPLTAPSLGVRAYGLNSFAQSAPRNFGNPPG